MRRLARATFGCGSGEALFAGDRLECAVELIVGGAVEGVQVALVEPLRLIAPSAVLLGAPGVGSPRGRVQFIQGQPATLLHTLPEQQPANLLFPIHRASFCHVRPSVRESLPERAWRWRSPEPGAGIRHNLNQDLALFAWEC